MTYDGPKYNTQQTPIVQMDHHHILSEYHMREECIVLKYSSFQVF